jgi:hypothetical protein
MVNKPRENAWNIFSRFIQEWFEGVHKSIQDINGSKIFAGLVVVTLNIASKFVNIRLSKTVEAYLKHTFSRDVLIFCIVWMGSREIYIAAAVTLCFILFMDFLLNEDSPYCILPESFTTYHVSLLETDPEKLGSATVSATVDGTGGMRSDGSQQPSLASQPPLASQPSLASQPVAANDTEYKPIQW